MICSSLKREIGFLFIILLRFLLRSFARLMGCFLGCLRAQDDDDLPRSQLVSDTSSSKSRGVVISRNPLSLFLSKAFKEKEGTRHNDIEYFGSGFRRDDQDFKDEAKVLIACDFLEGNPVEIQKASEKSDVSSDSQHSRFHSCLPKTSIEKLELEVQPYIPATPIKFCEEWRNCNDSLEHTLSSSISISQDTECDSFCSKGESSTGSFHTVYGTCDYKNENNADSASPWQSATDIQTRNKSVRFECETHLASCKYKQSPYPTPLKLSDEMQTPGTVYPATLEDQPNGKPQVKSQILYSIYNLGEEVPWSEIIEEENFLPEQDSGELSNSFEQPQNSTPPKDGIKEISCENESKLKASISSWSKPASIIQEERNRGMETMPRLCNTPTSRPIIGMVAAHWNEDPHIPSPEWWNGHGIPNTTKKYKEDQKVNWHATPFEERLEKALSEKSFISQRNRVCGKQSPFENGENDTALYQLQPSTHPQSVGSF